MLVPAAHLEFLVGGERDVARCRLHLPLPVLHLIADECDEVCTEVAPQQRLAVGDRQERGEQLGCKAWLQHLQSAAGVTLTRSGRQKEPGIRV